jgi:hypothetical protein
MDIQNSLPTVSSAHTFPHQSCLHPQRPKTQLHLNTFYWLSGGTVNTMICRSNSYISKQPLMGQIGHIIFALEYPHKKSLPCIKLNWSVRAHWFTCPNPEFCCPTMIRLLLKLFWYPTYLLSDWIYFQFIISIVKQSCVPVGNGLDYV